MIQVELKTANEIFVFTREPFLLGYTYFEKIHETKRAISKKFFLKIYELAKELNIKDRIDELELEYSIKGTAFKYFDKVIIKDIVEVFNSEIIDYDKYKKYIEIRLDNSLCTIADRGSPFAS